MTRLEAIKQYDAQGIGGVGVIAQRRWLIERVAELATALRILHPYAPTADDRERALSALAKLDEPAP